MKDRPASRLPWVSRALPYFMVWLAMRALYFLYLGSQHAEYRLAAEAGFGPVLWGAELAFAFLGVGAAVGMWLRWRHTMALAIAASGLYTSITLFQLWQMEQDPGRARMAYVASRAARGLPVPDDRLDQMFSESGRRVTWAIGGVFCLVPLGVLLWRRRDFEPVEETAP